MRANVRVLIFVIASALSADGLKERFGENVADFLSIRLDVNSDFFPRRSDDGRQISISSTSAEIIHRPGTVTLKCAGETASQNISWSLYRCPGRNGEVTKLPLSPSKNRDRYELHSARIAGKAFSSLLIKNVGAAETAGLYRCDVASSPLETDSKFFVVGRKKALGRCSPGTDPEDDGATLETIRKLVGAAESGSRDGRTHEYMLKLPFGRGKTHDYKIRFSTFGNGVGKSRETTSGIKGSLENLAVIKFEMSDASVPSWIENSIRGKG